MVTLNAITLGAAGNIPTMEFYALSTDTLPIGKWTNGSVIHNGSSAFLFDTSTVMMFDEENQQWLEI